ncbi:hypothetical protein [Streptomyces sp. NPDC055109]
MFIIYTPPGGEPEHYDARTLKVSEASIVQRTVDMKWQKILDGLQFDDLESMRAIVWVLKKRSNPSLRFGEFDPGVTEMTTAMDKREVEAYVDNFLTAGSTDPDFTLEVAARILMAQLPSVALDPEHARRTIAEKTAPKAETPSETEGEEKEPPTETAEASDSSPSPTSSAPEASTSGFSPTSSTSHPQESTTSSSTTSTP